MSDQEKEPNGILGRAPKVPEPSGGILGNAPKPPETKGILGDAVKPPEDDPKN